jgi:Rrf2 family protein
VIATGGVARQPQARTYPGFASTYRFGKTVSKALSISLHLAERWSLGRKVTAAELAREQSLPRPWVARLLGYLAHAGIVKASRGPGGGYVLAREPGAIRLMEIVIVFQSGVIDPWARDLPSDQGVGLAIHATNMMLREYLEKTTLGVFLDVDACPSPQDGRTDRMSEPGLTMDVPPRFSRLDGGSSEPLSPIAKNCQSVWCGTDIVKP